MSQKSKEPNSVTPRPRFTLRKGYPVPTVQEAGWAPELAWTQRLEEKSFASAGDRTPVVQSVVSSQVPQLYAAPAFYFMEQACNIAVPSAQSPFRNFPLTITSNV
jgi:hypothetical protein